MQLGDPSSLHAAALSETKTYLQEAAQMLDEQFGAGYARNNPHMLAAMVRACTDNFSAALVGKQIDEAALRLQELGVFLINRIQHGAPSQAQGPQPNPASAQPAPAAPPGYAAQQPPPSQQAAPAAQQQPDANREPAPAAPGNSAAQDFEEERPVPPPERPQADAERR